LWTSRGPGRGKFVKSGAIDRRLGGRKIQAQQYQEGRSDRKEVNDPIILNTIQEDGCANYEQGAVED